MKTYAPRTGIQAKDICVGDKAKFGGRFRTVSEILTQQDGFIVLSDDGDRENRAVDVFGPTCYVNLEFKHEVATAFSNLYEGIRESMVAIAKLAPTQGQVRILENLHKMLPQEMQHEMDVETLLGGSEPEQAPKQTPEQAYAKWLYDRRSMIIAIMDWNMVELSGLNDSDWEPILEAADGYGPNMSYNKILQIGESRGEPAGWDHIELSSTIHLQLAFQTMLQQLSNKGLKVSFPADDNQYQLDNIEQWWREDALRLMAYNIMDCGFITDEQYMQVLSKADGYGEFASETAIRLLAKQQNDPSFWFHIQNSSTQCLFQAFIEMITIMSSECIRIKLPDVESF